MYVIDPVPSASAKRNSKTRVAGNLLPFRARDRSKGRSSDAGISFVGSVDRRILQRKSASADPPLQRGGQGGPREVALRRPPTLFFRVQMVMPLLKTVLLGSILKSEWCLAKFTFYQ